MVRPGQTLNFKTMKTIWKFPIAITNFTAIEMPLSAEILTVQEQFNEPMMWALVDSDEVTEIRIFELFAIGQQVAEVGEHEERVYINTFQTDWGNYVFHLFEIKAKGKI